MPLYQYVKAYPLYRSRYKSIVVSLVLMSVGSAILIWVFWPIVSFTVFTAPLFSSVVSPVARDQQGIADRPVVEQTGGVLSPLAMAAGSDSFDQPKPIDYTNANVWFPMKPQKKVVTPVNTYKLSVPKLKIQDAVVIIAGDDLNKSLIHYGGTSLPGEYGTSVIFGHSVLPQFFNPKDYKTIFSTLPTIKVGDEVFIEYDGVRYRYVVFDMVITEPNDLSPLEQQFDDSYVTLITCVPPGTYWKRLNVKARLSRPPA